MTRERGSCDVISDGGSIIFTSASPEAVSVDFLPLISYNQGLPCWPGMAALDCFLREETSGRISVHGERSEKTVAKRRLHTEMYRKRQVIDAK